MKPRINRQQTGNIYEFIKLAGVDASRQINEILNRIFQMQFDSKVTILKWLSVSLSIKLLMLICR